jgi:chromate transporter
VPLDELFWTVLRVSWLTFGGGATAIPLLQHEVVDVHRAVGARELLTAVAIGRLTPGPNSLYISSLGYMLAGWLGSVVALAAMLVPCVSILPLEYVYGRLRSLRIVQGFANGVSIGATGLIVASVYTLSNGAIVDVPTLAIAGVAALIALVFELDSMWIVLGALALGVGGTFLW